MIGTGEAASARTSAGDVERSLAREHRPGHGQEPAARTPAKRTLGRGRATPCSRCTWRRREPSRLAKRSGPTPASSAWPVSKACAEARHRGEDARHLARTGELLVPMVLDAEDAASREPCGDRGGVRGRDAGDDDRRADGAGELDGRVGSADVGAVEATRGDGDRVEPAPGERLRGEPAAARRMAVPELDVLEPQRLDRVERVPERPIAEAVRVCRDLHRPIVRPPGRHVPSRSWRLQPPGRCDDPPMRDGVRTRVACLSSAPWNPYLRLLYAAVGRAGIEVVWDGRATLGWLWRSRRTVGVLHVHWPEGLYRLRRGPARLRGALSWAKLGLLALRLLFARLLGYRLVWTVHQVYPHETTSPRLDRVGARVLGLFADELIAHDGATAALVQRELGRHAEVIPHGSYLGVYPAGRARPELARELEIPESAFVFLAFGELRRYKGIDSLIEAFGALPSEDVYLVVAGNPKDAGTAAALQAAASRDPRLRLRLGFVADAEVAELFELADAVVLARADGGTSGSLILALSLGRPVVAADTPAYRELTRGSAGWLFPPGEPLGLRDALATAARDRADARRRGADARGLAAELDWGPIGELTARVLAPR